MYIVCKNLGYTDLGPTWDWAGKNTRLFILDIWASFVTSHKVKVRSV